jgi:hypothetical protein
VWAQDLNKGLKAAQSGDFATAMKEWRPLAEQGLAGAQNNLGLMYDKGTGVLQDTIAAHMWFNIAAANGNTKAAGDRDVAAGKLSSSGVEEAQKRAKRCMASDYKDCD